MMDKTDLIRRLEALDGPDRELDAEIDVGLFGGETVWKTTNYTMEQYPASRRANPSYVGGFASEHVPHYTASLDDAIALTIKVLPGWTIANIGQDDRKGWHAEIRKGYQTSYSTVKIGGASLPAIALLLALIPALDA
jgi:hypothetical protein